MRIDFENITESSQWFDAYLFFPYYQKLGRVSSLTALRLAAPLIGGGDGLMSAAQAIFGLAEALFKGSTNTLYGIANRDKWSLQKGALQLILGGGVIALASIPVILVRTIRITLYVAIDPAVTISNLSGSENSKRPRKTMGFGEAGR